MFFFNLYICLIQINHMRARYIMDRKNKKSIYVSEIYKNNITIKPGKRYEK